LLCWDLRRKSEILSGLKPNRRVETRVHEIQTDFFLRLLSRHFYPRVAIVPTIRTIFSLTRLVVVDTYHIYGMQQFLYWRSKSYFYVEAIRR
jgi:hypothetical protein